MLGLLSLYDTISYIVNAISGYKTNPFPEIHQKFSK